MSRANRPPPRSSVAPRPARLSVLPPRRLQDIRTLGGRRGPLPAQPAPAPADDGLRTWLFRSTPTSPPRLQRQSAVRGVEEVVVDRELEPEVAQELLEDGLLVLAELPGAHAASLSVTLHGDILCIQSGPPLRYYRELLLPYPALLRRQELRDGLLELELCPERSPA